MARMTDEQLAKIRYTMSQAMTGYMRAGNVDYSRDVSALLKEREAILDELEQERQTLAHMISEAASGDDDEDEECVTEPGGCGDECVDCADMTTPVLQGVYVRHMLCDGVSALLTEDEWHEWVLKRSTMRCAVEVQQAFGRTEYLMRRCGEGMQSQDEEDYSDAVESLMTHTAQLQRAAVEWYAEVKKRREG